MKPSQEIADLRPAVQPDERQNGSNGHTPGVARTSSAQRNIILVAKGGGVTFAGKMFLAVIRLVTAVLLTRLLGAHQYGMYNLGLSAANIAAGLAIFGLDTALVRYVAMLAGRRDERGVWGALQVGIGTATLLSVFTGTALYALAFPIASNVFHEPQLAPVLQLISAIVPFLVLSEVLAGANRGFKRMDYPVIAQFVAQPIIRLVLVLALAVQGLSTMEAIIIFGVADLAASLIMIYFLHKEFGIRRPVHAARRDVRAILGFSLPVWMSEMLVKFHNNIQTLFIGSLDSLAGVGVFSVASQLTVVSGQFSSSINTSTKPVIAELYDQGDMKQLGRLYQTTNKWALMVQFPVFLAMVLFPGPILSIFGETFAEGALVLAILALGDLIHVGTGMGGSIIDMTGHTRLKLVNSLLRLIVYLSLDILLIPQWGIVGAALAALIGEMFINLLRLLEVFFLFRLLPYNRTFIKPLLAALVALACVLLVNGWLPAGSPLVNTLINGAVLGVVYVSLLFLLGFSPEEQTMLNLIRQRVRRLIPRAGVKR